MEIVYIVVETCSGNADATAYKTREDATQLDDPIDDFCLHPEQLAKASEEELIKQYIDAWEDSLRQKHDNYDQNEEIQLSRIDEDTFRLFYEAENYEFVGTKEEVLEELSEHLDLKKF